MTDVTIKPFAGRPVPSRSAQWGRRLRVLFLLPLLRGRRHPELAARATAVGLFWAFTPTFGLRMPLVLATWLAARHVLKVDFTLVICLAWTWLTNALVTLPLYFGFYLTGRLLQGDVGDVMSFTHFRAAFTLPGAEDPGLMARLALTLRDWGATLWLGALPWAFFMAIAGYIGATRFLAQRRRRYRRPLQPGGGAPK